MKQETSYKYSFKMERRAASLYVQNTGRQQCEPGYRWGPGVRDHYLIHHVLSGRGFLEAGEKRYRLEAGDTFLVYPSTSILYRADDKEPWEYVWVGFHGMEARDLVEQTDFKPDAPVLEAFFPAEVSRLLLALYSDYGTDPWNTAAITGRLYLFLSFLIQHSRRAGLPSQAKNDCALRAASYIMSHYEQPITVEELAQFVSASQSSLYRCFKRKFSMSPKRFILEYRIEKASHLLQSGDFSIREISNSVGFEDPLYFSRVFKMIKGASPRDYALAKKKGGRE